jgi:hypothetical protein
MKRRITLLFLVVVMGLLLATPVLSAVVYDNGPINGTLNAWNIDSGYWVSNSFTLSSSSNLDAAQIGLWVLPGHTPSGLTWKIGNTPNDSSFGTGIATLPNSYYGVSGTFIGYDFYESTFPLSASLSAGTTYWLTLSGGLDNAGGAMFWDISNGPSQAWQSAYGDMTNWLPRFEFEFLPDIRHFSSPRTLNHASPRCRTCWTRAS